MARPERHDVDYFPFVVKRGKTLNILQNQFGLEGMGFFINLLRFLSMTPDHHYSISDDTDKMNFFSEIGIKDHDVGIAIIELLVKTGKLDKELWEKHKVIVSEYFLLSVKDAYKRRENKVITIEEIRKKYTIIPQSNTETPQSGTITPQDANFEYNNPQKKRKEKKVKEKKRKESKIAEAEPPELSESTSPQSSGKQKKLPLRQREPVNDMERVEKAYYQNWDVLYSRKLVKAVEPVVNWNQIRKLLKTHLDNITPEELIRAVNNGLKDDWVIKTGYSLATMLSANVLNRLINAGEGNRVPAGLDDKESLVGLPSIF